MQFRFNADIRGSFDFRIDVDSGVASVSDLSSKLNSKRFNFKYLDNGQCGFEVGMSFSGGFNLKPSHLEIA